VTGPGSTLVLDSVSRWFGNVVAVNDVSLTIGPGVTGLLGPNGAGKTTLMALMTGFLAPSAGTVTLDGEPVWRHTEAYRRIGLVPERELSFGYLTGRQFVRANADLHRLPDAAAATERILEVVDMVEPAGRRLDTTPRACGSGSRSPPRWCTTRRCCSSTSPSTASTRASGCT
jgi:ABC-2 type transport system ATP-binding protein